jgi:HK97 family phage major capsid protein
MSALAAKLPPRYLAMPGTAWMMHPNTISALRDLKAASGSNLTRQISEGGFEESGPGRHMFGYPIIPNPNMATIGATKNAVYFANWPSFLTIADFQTMDIQALDQTAPGFITLFAQARVVSGVRDPFAGVRLVGV